ncbi:hypothetical protein [Halarchaeum nitratireducens]|uniref:MBL fold metallo-hydrolase n=1 Tax=Halarchaeum nitratireducens TaxID=489913 RepID=A0A830GFF7_9EURY|nr:MULTISPECIES: hypothetical protein [Halarchaeum]MBP2251648.1 hypothetical protein [Halarchaeum solikamskense]GGN23480.1 hypothetical protein GCM10009021_26250 [Halarchaeum nitratireducens]
MPSADGDDTYEELNRFDGGTSWLAHPDEAMQRVSHVLDTDAGVFLVDPIDVSGIDDLAAEFGDGRGSDAPAGQPEAGASGDVAGVVLLLNRHERDAATVARRHDVPVYLPSFLTREVDAPTERFDGSLPGTDYGLLRTLAVPGWHEAALFDGETLVVPEAVGTAPFFHGADEQLGVHPMLRLTPPSTLRGLRPERILVGHGRGVHEAAADSLRYALEHSRSNAPGVWAGMVRELFR